MGHEEVGASFLRGLGFPEVTCGIVSGHVNAKRVRPGCPMAAPSGCLDELRGRLSVFSLPCMSTLLRRLLPPPPPSRVRPFPGPAVLVLEGPVLLGTLI
jgi:hypothetical protein